MGSIPESNDFYGQQCREEQMKARHRMTKLLCWLFAVTSVALGVFSYMQHTLVRGCLHELEKKETAYNVLESRYEYQTNRYEECHTELTNTCEQLKRESERVVKEGNEVISQMAQVNHWKRETEKAKGSVVVVERREKKVVAELARLQAEYAEVKEDNDKLNKYLKGFKESTKAKLIELDKRYIEQQFELRKYKRNYETLLNCLQRKVQQKQEETSKDK